MSFPSEDVRAKAISLYEGGHVRPLPEFSPGISSVLVLSTDDYQVHAHAEGFMCDCRASADHSWTEPRCSHVLAAMLYWAEAAPSPAPAGALGGRSARPDGKPAPRVTLPSKEWHELIREKCYGLCRLCGTNWHWSGMSAHHLLKRSQGGDDVADNGVYLCGSGTTGCHGDVEAKLVAKAVLRAKLTGPELTYLIEKVGEERLNNLYPLGAV